MKYTKLSKKLIFSTILFIFHIFIFVAYAILINTKYNYLYPSISNYDYFLMSFLIIILIPAILYFCSVILCSKQRLPLVSTTIIVTLILLLPISFTTALMTRAGISSHTTDIANYPRFDVHVETLQEYKDYHIYLPQIDPTSRIAKYNYDYNYGTIRESFCIELEVVFEDCEQYNKELLRISNLDMTNPKPMEYLFISPSGTTDIAIHINDSTKVIQYIIDCR